MKRSEVLKELIVTTVRCHPEVTYSVARENAEKLIMKKEKQRREKAAKDVDSILQRTVGQT
jgi:hypothetical protein